MHFNFLGLRFYQGKFWSGLNRPPYKLLKYQIIPVFKSFYIHSVLSFYNPSYSVLSFWHVLLSYFVLLCPIMSYPLPFFYFLPIPLRSFKYRPCISYYFSSCSFQYFLSHNVLFISRPFISHHFSFFPIPSFSILYILILCFLSRFNIYFPFFIALFLSFTLYFVLSSFLHPIPSLYNYFL